ncbi:MAG: CHAT domain-containing protein, partial [Bacteroidetes bacterium]
DSLLHYLHHPNPTDPAVFAGFCHWSHEVYKLIFGGREQLLTQPRLVIVPDGELGQIPFDLLLRSLPGPDHRGLYRGLDYLVNHLDISYAYSARSYLEAQAEGPAEVEGMLSFLPDFGLDSSVAVLREMDLTRRALAPLPGAKREVAFAAEALGAEVVTDAEAREDRFRALAGDYDILHLATHGVAHPLSPLESRIALNQQVPTGPLDPNDGFLFGREIYGLELDCELAILSACETGAGRYAEGEGVLNFAHAFRFAGARSVLTTHWPVPDASSADLMIDFMSGLEAGLDKASALSRAKRRYLQQADELHAHPFYWAGYTLTGSTQPLHFAQKARRRWIWGGLIGFLLLFLLAGGAWYRGSRSKT